ncbi:MAG: hypothetical protein QW303_04165 [Nitrososphaerota archaeon]
MTKLQPHKTQLISELHMYYWGPDWITLQKQNACGYIPSFCSDTVPLLEQYRKSLNISESAVIFVILFCLLWIFVMRKHLPPFLFSFVSWVITDFLFFYNLLVGECFGFTLDIFLHTIGWGNGILDNFLHCIMHYPIFITLPYVFTLISTYNLAQKPDSVKIHLWGSYMMIYSYTTFFILTSPNQWKLEAFILVSCFFIFMRGSLEQKIDSLVNYLFAPTYPAAELPPATRSAIDINGNHIILMVTNS